MRRFDPADQRTTGKADAFTLMPASEALLDEDSDQALPRPLSRAFRRHRHRRPAVPGGQRGPAAGGHGALAAAVRGPAGDPVRPSRRRRRHRPRRQCRRRARGPRREAIEDYFANRERAMVAEPGSYRPLPPDDALSVGAGMAAARSPIGRSTSPSPFHEPESDRSSTSRSTGARDFAPERAAERQCLRSGRQACRQAAERQAERSSSRATAPAPASGLPGCSRIMASRA